MARPDQDQFDQCAKQVSVFAESLEKDGYSAFQVVDSLIVTAIHAAVLLASRKGTAAVLREWADKIERGEPIKRETMQ